ncbi:inactive sodium-dependent neutral amino acid transporter B(0)AT3-like isoform X2 [Hylaeus volcanicus]|uniref:inactive sodium-dependent neutral amino acid transporter B(0)AT3-like isoform X2 n=1 Tax=Hylaeus volcanicus TaxID=313075 RepID=UPI0023B80955|nr:inactive sodium-dependent neutral amino acid transporter B(0)AT3-like isoform X2 [Hylaeus volcanicus]
MSEEKTKTSSNSFSIIRNVNRLCGELRCNVFKSIQYHTKNSNNIIPILKTAVPTDPLGIETSTHGVKDTQRKSQFLNTYCLSSSSYMTTLVSLSLNSATYTMYARQAYITQLGLLFCVPYTISWFVLAKPLIELETTLGQMTQSGPFTTYSMLHPQISGIGISMVLLSFLMSIVDMYYAAEALRYTISSLHRHLPWDADAVSINYCGSIIGIKKCNTSELCKYDTPSRLCIPSMVKLAYAFYLKSVYSKSLEQSSFVFDVKLFLCLLLTGIIVTIIAYQGSALLTPPTLCSTTSLALHTLIAITFVNLESSYELTLGDLTDRKKWIHLLTKGSPWTSAVLVVLASTDIIGGAYYALGSWTTPRTRTIHGSIISLLVQIYVGSITSMVLSESNSLLPTLILPKSNSIKKILFSRSSTFPFVLFPMAVLYLPGPPLFSILIFLFIWVQRIIKIVFLFSIVQTFLQDSQLASHLSKLWRHCTTCALILLCTAPYALNFNLNMSGSVRIVLYDFILHNLVTPVLGVIQITGLESFYRTKFKQSALGQFPNVLRQVVLLLHTLFLYKWSTMLPQSYGLPSFKLFLLCLLLYIMSLAILSMIPYLSIGELPIRFYWWTCGGMNVVRQDLNRNNFSLFHINKKLTLCWSILMTLVIPFLLVFIFLYYITTIKQYTNILPEYKIMTCIIAIYFVVFLPTVVRYIFPKAMSVFSLTNTKVFSTNTVLCTKEAHYGMRRRPLDLFEEFYSADTINRNAYELRFQKITSR